MEIILKKYLYKGKEINLTIKSNTTVGIIGDNLKDFLEMLSLKSIYKGNYYINDNKVTKDTLKVFRKRKFKRIYFFTNC